jgi:uncharacterized protein GlcG (DUF336 family)
MPTQVDLATAQSLVDASVKAAGEMGVPVAVAVTDLGGHVVASARMDGVGFVMAEVARRKAMTAGTFSAPTHAIAELAKSDPLINDAFTGVDEIIVLGGGYPVVDEGACVGGLGVSGGHYTQDQAVAEAALGLS